MLASGILFYFFGLDSLPLLAPRQELGNADISIKVGTYPEALNAHHVRLVAPKEPSTPRLVEISLPNGMRVSAEWEGSLAPSDILVLQPGQGRRLAFGKKNGRVVEIRPDRPLAGAPPLKNHQLVVARLSRTAADWSAQLSGIDRFRKGRRTLYIALSNGFQGGEWCEQAGFRFRVLGLKQPFTQQLSCLSRPQSIQFDQEVPWTASDTVPKVLLEAWKREAVFQHGRSLIARWNPDVSRVATFFNDYTPVASSRTIETTADDHVVNLWSLSNPAVSVPLEHNAAVIDARFSPDGSRLATIDADRTIRVWEVEQPDSPIKSLDNSEPLQWVVFNKSGRLAMISNRSDGGTVRIWQPDGSTSPILFPPQLPIRSFSFSSDGARFATGDVEGTVRIWNTDKTGKPTVLQDPRCAPADDSNPESADRNGSPVNDLAFSPDGTRIITASASVVCFWKANGEGKPVIRRHKDKINSVAFGPEGSSPRVLTASADGSARLWSQEGERLRSLPHQGAVEHAVFSSDGSRIATAAKDGVRVWDLADSPIFFRLKEGAWSVGFSNDGKRLIAYGTSGPARVWDVSHPLGSKETGDLFLFLRVSPKRELESSDSQDAP